MRKLDRFESEKLKKSLFGKLKRSIIENYFGYEIETLKLVEKTQLKMRK